MTAKRRTTRSSKKQVTIGSLIAVAVITVVFTVFQPFLEGMGFSLEDIIDLVWQPSVSQPFYPAEGTAEVHFIDVGQASCILIKGSEKTAMIDAGEASAVEDIVAYLEDNGVSRIDYFFNTHPHADHMGGCRGVMQAIPTGEFIMPKLSASAVPTTSGYKKLLTYLAENKASITTVQGEPGDVYELGGGLRLEQLAPVEEYSDLNNSSLVLRMDFGATSFLFTGDAEAKSEQDILSATDIGKISVLAAPHHGSSTSIDPDFMKEITPTKAQIAAGTPRMISIISCGADNDYGHPHQETLELYRQLNIDWYRTDKQGSILVVTDGNSVTVTTER